MIIVIQCASKKTVGSRSFQYKGRTVCFVARPHLAPSEEGALFAKPDDQIPGETRTWRDYLVEANATSEPSSGLTPASRLYRDPTYTRLRTSFASKDLYILSAGWGLVRSDFLLPTYDITFTPIKEQWKRRSKSDEEFLDFNQLENASLDSGEEIHFFGGNAYLPLFLNLTANLRCQKLVHYQSAMTTLPLSYEGIRHYGNRNIKWHYDAISAFLDARNL